MPKRSLERLSEKRIKSIAPPDRGYVIVYDADVPGFGVRVTSKGVRSFVLNYLFDRRERRLTIGRYPDWSATAAREQARKLKRRINQGIDPMGESDARRLLDEAARSAPSVRDLFDKYSEEHLPTKSARSAADDRSMWRDYILPRLGNINVQALTAQDVDALHAAVTVKGPVRANRVIEVLRKALNLSIRWGWRSDNPAIGVKRNRETPRQRFLAHQEIRRLATALQDHPERSSADAILLMMLTGARRSEVLNATWDQFDLGIAVWIKPSAHTKQRREHRVPISPAAVAHLKRMELERSSDLVFPSANTGRPLADVRRCWTSVCREAGLAQFEPKLSAGGEQMFDRAGNALGAWRPTVRLHDLRHTFASVLASSGESLLVIGALLGHTQAQTTARYAHLLDDPLRRAAAHVGDLVDDRSRTPNTTG